MKKIIGKMVALYPMPVVVVGAFVENKPNWLLVAHTGIIGHDRMMISSAATHYTNNGISLGRMISLNIIDRPLLAKADKAGSVSGSKEDKSELFSWNAGDYGAPLITDSKLSMECNVVDIYESDGFHNYILQPVAVYAEDSIIDDRGKIDYEELSPVLFDMPNYEYLETGKVIGRCLSFSGNEE